MGNMAAIYQLCQNFSALLCLREIDLFYTTMFHEFSKNFTFDFPQHFSCCWHDIMGLTRRQGIAIDMNGMPYSAERSSIAGTC